MLFPGIYVRFVRRRYEGVMEARLMFDDGKRVTASRRTR